MTPKAEHIEKRIRRLEDHLCPPDHLDALSLMRERSEKIKLLLGMEPYTPTQEERIRVEKLRSWLEGGD